MQLSRRQTLTVLAITAAATVPASVAKAATQPLFTTFVSVPDEDGTLMVGVTCAVPVTAVSVRVTDRLGAEVGRYQLTLGAGSDPRNGLWRSAPLPGGMALGTYTMRFEATSQDGGAGSAQTELFLWLQPEFTLTSTPSMITPARPTVTVEGTIMGRHPVTQAVAPIRGLPLLLALDHFDHDVPDPPPLMLTSSPSGRFTGQFTPGDGAVFKVSTNAPERETFIFERSFTGAAISAPRVPVRITLNVDATHLDVGQSSTVDGLLEHSVDGQWRPMTGHAIAAAYYVQGSSQGAITQRGTTNNQARFRFTATPPSWGFWLVWIDRQLPFYNGTSAQSPVVYIVDPVSFDEIRASPTPRPYDGYRWEMSGVVSNRHFAPTVVIQFRPNPASAWRELSRVVGTAAGFPRWAFRAEFTLPGSGQIRGYLPPSNYTQQAASTILTAQTGPPRTPVRPDPDRPPPPPYVRTRPPTRGPQPRLKAP